MSFQIALSGLNAASTDLQITSNNIANANTTGFKSSRGELADVFSGDSVGIGTGSLLCEVLSRRQTPRPPRPARWST